jgi:hypothetical protein
MWVYVGGKPLNNRNRIEQIDEDTLREREREREKRERD